MAIKEYNIKSLKEYMECINELHTDNKYIVVSGGMQMVAISLNQQYIVNPIHGKKKKYL